MAGTTQAGPGTATDGDGGVKEQAQEKMQDVREQAGEQARQAAGQARDRVREQLDQRSTQAGERVSEQAGDLRSVADQLREHGKAGPARIAEQAAERTERVGSWLTESDADRILSDVEDFARRSPMAVAAGGLLVGFVASRLLKASSSQRYEQRMSGGRQLSASSAPPVDQPLSTDAPAAARFASPADAPPPAVPVTPPRAEP
ncbi:MAG: hypothetical protein QOD81_2536 [Solirubrobacteraceae bacterium]|jgi:hypothetical protein|nr:hypothetical protein [Solirubrobacteraceae bacterium]